MTGPEISRRESEVLALVGESLTNAQIAERLVLSERTVESHVSSLLRKLGASDRRELARIAGRSSVSAPWVAPSALPPLLAAVVDPSTYVGRSEVRAALEAQWRRAVAGATVGFLLAGEAGMGKTRAVAEFAAGARDQGARVLFGGCYQDVDAPFGPFVAAIEGDAATMTDDALRARGRSREVLGLLAPPLARALHLERSAHRVTPDREAVLDALGDWVLVSAREAPVVLVLEDLHWSTSSTRDAVRQLLRSPGRAPVLVVATTRIEPGDVPPGFDAFLADLRRLPTLAEAVLEGLSVEEVALLTGAGEEDSAHIRDQSGGNPLLVTHAATDGGRTTALDAMLASRDVELDAVARDVLDLAAVLGHHFDLDDLVRVHGGDLAVVLAALEAIEAVGLVVSPREGPARFAFAHALIRDHRYGSLPWRRRLELHARVARAMADRDERSLSDHARHACLAVPVGPAAPAIDLARRAGERAEAVFAFEEAEAHYRRALHVVGALDPAEEGVARELAVRVAAVRHHGGNPAGFVELLAAAEDARAAGDDSALVVAATSLPQLGAPLDPTGPDDRITDVVEAALAVLDARPSAARAILELFRMQTSGSFWDDGDHRLLVHAATRSEAMARELDDPDVLADVLLHAIHFHSFPSQVGELERIAVELERVGHWTGRITVRLLGIQARANAKRARGDLDGWRVESERLAALLGARPVPLLQLFVAAARSHRAFYDGDLATAAARARELGPLAVAVGHPPGTWVGASLTPVHRARAEDARMLRPLQRAATERPGAASIHCLLAAAQARAGDLDAARRTIDSLRRAGLRVPEEYAWSVSLGELAEAAELVGDPEVGDHVLHELGPFPGCLIQGGSITGRPFDESMAQAALATGAIDAAEEHATHAVDWARAVGAPVYLARALVFLAQARRRGGASARATAPLVDEALDLAGRHDIRVAVVDIDRYALRP